MLIRERALGSEVGEAMYARGDYDAPWSVSEARLEMDVVGEPEGVAVSFRAVEAGVTVFEKCYHFVSGGRLVVDYRWLPAAFGPTDIFAPELSYAGPMEITCSPGAPVWSHDIVTVAKSEKELETTIQGRSSTPRWPAQLGESRIEISTSGR